VGRFIYLGSEINSEGRPDGKIGKGIENSFKILSNLYKQNIMKQRDLRAIKTAIYM
jgi:hypothetical protein